MALREMSQQEAQVSIDYGGSLVALSFRMLERALKDIVHDPLVSKAEKCSRRHTVRECAVSWVKDEVKNPALSFEVCCDAMSWDPSWVRRKFLEAKSDVLMEALGLRRGIACTEFDQGGYLIARDVREKFYEVFPDAPRICNKMIPTQRGPTPRSPRRAPKNMARATNGMAARKGYGGSG